MSKENKNIKKETEAAVARRKKNSTKTKNEKSVTVTKKNATYKNKSAFKAKQPLTDEEKAIRTRRAVIIIISIILAAALILGIVLGIVTLVRNASYVMKLERVGVDKGVAAFLISMYKHDYLQNLVANGVDASDSDSFWEKARVTGNEGDLFNYEATEYLKAVIAANVLFDEYAKLSKDDEYKIEFAVQEVLNYQAAGSKKTFNELTKEMGFDYKDFKKGTEMLYKLRVVYTTVFGESGSKMQTSFANYCEEFYNNNYIRAKILVIRTEDTYEFDNGEMIKGDDGKYKTRPLTPEEKAKRAEYIARLDECVENLKVNPNNTIAMNDFNNLLALIADEYNENVTSGVKNGYYLAANSEYTSKLGLDEIVKDAFDLDIGEIAVHTHEAGVAKSTTEESSIGFSYKCYVYRMEKENKAYKDSSLEHFFYDFNSLASVSLYGEMIDEYSKDVELRDKWDAINPIAIPRNYDFRVKSFG